MSNKPYTPGPWYAVDYAGFWALQTDPDYDVHDDLLDEARNDLAKQNAKLAACSPELLESLQEMVEVYDGYQFEQTPLQYYAMKKAKEVIAKALNQ